MALAFQRDPVEGNPKTEWLSQFTGQFDKYRPPIPVMAQAFERDSVEGDQLQLTSMRIDSKTSSTQRPLRPPPPAPVVPRSPPRVPVVLRPPNIKQSKKFPEDDPQDMPFTPSVAQYQDLDQPQPHQPHQLPPPSDGFDLSIYRWNMNLEMNQPENVDCFAVQSVNPDLDQRPPEAFNTAYPEHFQGSDQFGFEPYPMGGSQEDLQDPDQPGPSHRYHIPQAPTFSDFIYEVF
ncbi:unnamed protein product, partial [Mesorhabditis belari]|uniref:Uncharacterized protein n=1 Tax=Mesorhabditis belari TaxID=2138241 RepID=A0AAF3EXG6_9BILA